MRIDTIRFEIPKQTSQFTPLQAVFVLPLPVIDSIVAQIPEGHKGLTEMSIRYPGGIIMDGIKGDKQTKESGALGVRLFGPPYYINCVGWNSDVFLPHEFILEINTRD